jgi:hypothetical protein
MNETVIDEIVFDDEGRLRALKGHVEFVHVEIKPNFQSCFEDRTLKVLFWEQFADDDREFYCGG